VLNDTTGTVQDFIEVSDVGTLAIYQQKTNDFETYKTVLDESILPQNYSVDPQLWYALVLMILGFLTIFILEKIGTKKL